MKNVLLIATLIVLVSAARAPGQCGSSTAKNDEPPGIAKDLTAGLARIIIKDEIGKRDLYTRPATSGFMNAYRGDSYSEAKNVRLTRDELTFEVTNQHYRTRDTYNTRVVFARSAYWDCAESGKDRGIFVATHASYEGGGDFIFRWPTEHDAELFTAAVNRLIYDARNSGGDGLTTFQNQVSAWLAKPETAPKPPDGWDKYRILAEHAYAEHDYISAVKNYEAAVAAMPTWAEGWFNAALLYGGMEEYAYAADRMRHYLILKPDAPDAPAAREKIVVWDDKAKK